MQGCFFLSLLSCNFDDQLSQHFHRFVILCICLDTPSESTCLDNYRMCHGAFNINDRVQVVFAEAMIGNAYFHSVTAFTNDATYVHTQLNVTAIYQYPCIYEVNFVVLPYTEHQTPMNLKNNTTMDFTKMVAMVN